MSERKNDLLAETERAQLANLRRAVSALYMSGKWKYAGRDPLTPTEELKLWSDVRDAMGFKPGYNTTVSIT